MKLNFNSKITNYFLENSRVTLLALISLVIFGVASFSLLKTTGFPSPEINFVIVNTVYPGASANTILEQVTKPLETAIKPVEGVKSYSSNSANSVSTISIAIAEGANVDAVKAKIDATVKAVSLPEGAENSELITPKVSSDEYYFALVRKDGSVNTKETFEVLEKLRLDVEKDTEVSSINVANKIDKKIALVIDAAKLETAGLTYTDVINQLRTWELSLPVAQNATLDEKRYNVLLSISGSSLDDIRNISLFSTTKPGRPVKLGEVASVEERYYTQSEINAVLGYRDGDVVKVSASTPFSIDTNDTTDLNKYDPKLQKILNKFFVPESEEAQSLFDADKALFARYDLIPVYSVAESNQTQTHEVYAGMVGEPWDGLKAFKWIGFAFGGIQLVFLMMLAFVSWRAALISAAALPLSFFFSVIWVKLTGNDLNTLVLFSLVLVIGLVVDPALVVLESIQRNIDNGFKGKEAVLRAVNEVGTGLFLAVLTSVLVFVPFGVVSGVFGAIIKYIPLTIIPAIIGSYIVPLVFLSWIGGMFLKRKKNTSQNEEENLWRVAQWMIRFNERILHSNALIRLSIILVSIIVPFAVAAFYMGTGRVKSVQFAQPEDSEFLQLSTENYPQKTPQDLQKDDTALLTEILKVDQVEQVTPLSQGVNVSYFIKLKEKSERKGYTASRINQDLKTRINEQFKDTFFTIDVATLGAGPSTSAFPVTIAVKTNDLNVQRNVSLDITNILNTVCVKEKSFELKSDCAENDKVVTKVDNGYDGKANKNIEVLLQRERLALNPVNPIEVRGIIANLFKVNDGKKVGTFKDNGSDLDIVLDKTAASPRDIEQIRNIPLTTLDGRTIKLSDIAEIRDVDSINSIRRVKGETVGVVSAKLKDEYADSANIAAIQKKVIEQFNASEKTKYSDVVVENYSEGDIASIAKSFTELGIAFLLAIVLTYLVLVIFFNSFTQPLVILFSIPLTFIGIFPALAAFGGGQLGFLEIIGIIILVGLVENVAIFLIDAANQKVREGWDEKKAIAYASGVRFRPILLTKLTTLVSTAPLAVLSEQYRSLSVVIIFGLLTSGIVSLVTSPILYIYFKNLSRTVRAYPGYGKVLFMLFFPVAILVMPLYNFFTRQKNS
jgi:hydrophobic/amphiphilic exporter-1 (mainly G- bacteria), HAE1 family